MAILAWRNNPRPAQPPLPDPSADNTVTDGATPRKPAEAPDPLLWTIFPQTTQSASQSWTLGLDGSTTALSPPLPARVRRGSELSLGGYSRDRDRWTGTAVGGNPAFQRGLRRATSAGGDSSAGGSSAEGMRLHWNHPSRTPSSPSSQERLPSSPSSNLTFGQSGSDGNDARRRGESSPSESRRGEDSVLSASPTPASLSTRDSHGIESDTSSLMADARAYRARSRSSPRPHSAGSPRSGLSLHKSLSPQKSFSEESWEFKVAKNLFLTGSGSRPPSQSPSQASKTLLTSPKPNPPTPSTSKSRPPVLPFPLTPPPSRPPVLASASPRGRHSIESTESDESDVSWHDAEEEAAAERAAAERAAEDAAGEDEGELTEKEGRPYMVQPASRAAISWSSSLGGERTSVTSAVYRSIFPLSPPLSPAEVIDSQGSDNPFDDDPNEKPLQDDWSAVDLEESPIYIPLPAGPIKSAMPDAFLRSPPNFLSATPRELRHAWRREQRLSTRGDRVPSPVLEARLSVEERGHPSDLGRLIPPLSPFSPNSPFSPTSAFSSNTPTSPTQPSRRRSFASSLSSKQNPFHRLVPRPLALVPPGAWLFIFGFVCPPLWWLGSFFPREVKKKGRESEGARPALTEVRVERQWGPMSRWPDRREGARRPNFDDARGGGGRLSRAIEGGGDWWESEPGWLASQQSILSWRRRNRIMSFVSIFMLAAVIGVAIWAGETSK